MWSFFVRLKICVNLRVCMSVDGQMGKYSFLKYNFIYTFTRGLDFVVCWLCPLTGVLVLRISLLSLSLSWLLLILFLLHMNERDEYAFYYRRKVFYT